MVATTVGETLRASIRGASTITYVMWLRSRKASVSERFSSSSQLACRNSTSISSPPSCSFAHSRYSSADGLKTMYGGSCIRIPPSLRVSRNGSSASWKRRKTSARNSRGGRSTRPRESSGAASRRSGGSCSALTGWRVITPKAFTCMTNPSGVRSAQCWTMCSSGSR